ncbi:MAG TPA: hypothetical protein VGE51_06045 [Fontimonas sp.]
MADHVTQKIRSDGAANAVLSWVAAFAALAVALLFMVSEIGPDGHLHPVLYFPALIAGVMVVLALFTTRRYLRTGKAVLHIRSTVYMGATFEAMLALPGTVQSGDNLQITLRHRVIRGHDPKSMSARTVWSAASQVQASSGPNGSQANVSFTIPEVIPIDQTASRHRSWDLEVRATGESDVIYNFRNIDIRGPQ